MEALCKKLLDEIYDGVFIFDNDFKYLDLNKSACLLSGFSKEEFLGKSIFDIIGEEYREMFQTMLKKVDEGETVSFRQNVFQKNGKPAVIEAKLFRLTEELLCGVINDISMEASFKQKLSESSKNFSQLAETVSSGIKVIQDGKLLFVNTCMEELTGYSREELERMEFYQIVHPDYHDIIINKIGRIKDFGISPEAYEVRIITKSGEERWIEARDSIIEVDTRPALMVCFHDITTYKQLQKELKEKEERYRYILELLPDAVYLRIKDIIVYTNQAAAKIFGCSCPEDAVNRRITDFLQPHPDYEEAAVDIRQQLEKHGFLPSTRLRLVRHADGEVLDLEVAMNTVAYNEQSAILGVAKDISDRVKSEELEKEYEENTRLLSEALEYDKLKTDFFANLSHELRTPLNVILGVVQLQQSMHSKEKDSKEIKYINIMKQNCYRLMRLVNNLLDITKIDAGFFPVNLRNIDIVSVSEDITQSVVEYANSRGIELVFDTDMEEKLMALDPDMMERILMNLLSNAMKFTPAGGNITVTLSDRETRVRISVKDTGSGIPKDKQKAVFNRFVQADQSLVSQSKGTGIGLSLVKALVEIQGGSLSLLSEEGKGTEFVIELPCRLIEDGEYRDNGSSAQNRIERINIEFADIYRHEQF